MATGSLPVFGLKYIRLDDQPQPVLGANLDVVGIIGPNDDADPDYFPLDTPVLLFSNDTATITAKLWKNTNGVLTTDGYIVDAINGINDQLADYQVAAQLVIVRTARGLDDEANVQLQQTIANIMGNSSLGTGVHAFKNAPNMLFCTPRLIIAPGYTGMMATSLDTILVGTPGIGYKPNTLYNLTFTQGPDETNVNQVVMPRVYAIADANGGIDNAQLTIDSYGAWMTDEPTVTVPVPDGPLPVATYALGAFQFSAQPGDGSTLTFDDAILQFTGTAQPGASTYGLSGLSGHLTGGTTGPDVAASGHILFHYNPSPGDSITLGGLAPITFVASGATGAQVNIGVDLATTLGSLLSYLNGGGAGVYGANITYGTSGTPVDTLTLVYKTIGTGGNAFTMVTDVTTYQITLGAALDSTLANLMTYLQTSRDVSVVSCTYRLEGGNLILTAATPGVAGNGFLLDTTVYGCNPSGPHMAGGADAGAAVRCLVTCTVAPGANPVCAELSGGVLDSLMAHAIVETSGVSYIDDLSWRSVHNSQRLIGYSGGCKILDANGFPIVVPRAGREVGAIIARDFSTGYPFHSAANEPISGIIGPARTIAFSLTDGATEGQQLLAANLGVLVRGLIGVETAISSGGFVTIATDNLGDDELWRMYNVTRGRDYIELSLMPALRVYLGRSNIDRQTVMNILSTINDLLSQLKALNQILGYKTGFQGNLNSASEIRLGHLTVSFAAEEPPVLKRITTMSARYRPAIDALIADLSAQLNFSA